MVVVLTILLKEDSLALPDCRPRRARLREGLRGWASATVSLLRFFVLVGRDFFSEETSPVSNLMLIVGVLVEWVHVCVS